MSNPRKFADKIALIQQKQAESDVAFRTILCEVGEAKQRGHPIPTAKCKLDVPINTYEQPFENYQGSNGMNNSDKNYTSNYVPQAMKIDNGHECDQLLQLPDNPSWRRTNSDPSLHYTMMPTGIPQYSTRTDNGNHGQAPTHDRMTIKFEPTSQTPQQHHPQFTNHPFQTHPSFDFNHNVNQNYIPTRSTGMYPPQQLAPTASLPTQPTPSVVHTHAMLGPRYSGGSTGSNVLMLPPPHHPRGGSLPDLRTGNAFHPHQVSFSTTPSPPSPTSHHFFRSSSPQESGDSDLYIIGPQQQLPSNIGPLKQSPSIRRRHSPIGEMKQSSPRRQNSPSPDVVSNQQPHYRVEPSSPQSQSSYSPQNSPHLLASPGNDHSPFSPQQSIESNQQNYFALSSHFDQITLDHKFFTQSQSTPSSNSSSQPANHHHSSSSTNSVLTSLSDEMNDNHLNYFRPRNFYPPFMDNMPSGYNQTQTSVTVTTNVNQKSPTIPNIILTDVDSSKLDLSKELANDFSNAFDSLIDSGDLQLNADDFLLNGTDLSMDPNMCDDEFRMEN